MNRRWTIRTRILTLLFAPLVPLLAMLIFATSVALGPAVNLRDANTAAVQGGLPAATVLLDLQTERELSVILVSSPTAVPQAVSALTNARAQTDSAYGSLQKAVTGGAFTAAANDQVLRYLDVLKTQLGKLEPTRNAVDRGTSRLTVMTFYNAAIETTFGLYGAIDSLDDHTLSRQADIVVQLAESSEMLAREDALLAGPFTSGVMTNSDYQQLVGTIYTKRYLYAQATRYLTGDAAAAYTAITNSDAYARLRAMEDSLINHPNIGKAPFVNATTWHNDFTSVSTSLGLFEAGEATSAINGTHTAAVSREWRLAIIVGISVLMLLTLLYFSLTIARAVIRRITALRQDALSLALDRLPSVVERLRNGEAVDVDAETPPLRHGHDELGQLGDAFTRVQSTAIAAAVHEANLRNGFNQVFLNIARRSQTLLHRQLALLDGMERRTNDPDELEELFRVDHLATRMRRHAEDLVILAGSAPGRGWRNPVPVADVLRAAASEVEEYARIVAIGLPDIALAGRAVSDVVHLLAELLENATLFSPPDTQVSLSGQMVPNGFAIEIEDRGLGMQVEAIREANVRLASPPEFDPAHSSRLGLFVVARLAARHNIEVVLRRSPYGGVTAVALIPSELVVHPGEIVPGSLDVTMNHRVPAPRTAIGEYATADTGRTLTQVAATPVAVKDMSLRAASVSLTSDGLPQRVRQASLSRQLTESGNGSSFGPSGGDTSGSVPAVGGGAGAPAAPVSSPPAGLYGAARSSNPNPDGPVTRTPEQMRSMLSSFQDGMALGRRDAVGQTDPQPRASTPGGSDETTHPLAPGAEATAHADAPQHYQGAPTSTPAVYTEERRSE